MSYRGFCATRGPNDKQILRSSNGTPTNAIHGLLGAVRRMIKELQAQVRDRRHRKQDQPSRSDARRLQGWPRTSGAIFPTNPADLQDVQALWVAPFSRYDQDGHKPGPLPCPTSPGRTASTGFVRTIKESCLNRMVLIGEFSLHRATSHFVFHYHGERNHRGLGNKIIRPEFTPFLTEGPIKCR